MVPCGCLYLTADIPNGFPQNVKCLVGKLGPNWNACILGCKLLLFSSVSIDLQALALMSSATCLLDGEEPTEALCLFLFDQHLMKGKTVSYHAGIVVRRRKMKKKKNVSRG